MIFSCFLGVADGSENSWVKLTYQRTLFSKFLVAPASLLFRAENMSQMRKNNTCAVVSLSLANFVEYFNKH